MKSNVNNNFKFSTQAAYNVITSCYILSSLITPSHILSPILHRKVMLMTTFHLVPTQASYIVVTSCHILSRLIELYHTFFPIFHRKLISVTAINLVPILLEILSHLAPSYHPLSDLITLYSKSFIER